MILTALQEEEVSKVEGVNTNVSLLVVRITTSLCTKSMGNPAIVHLRMARMANVAESRHRDLLQVWKSYGTLEVDGCAPRVRSDSDKPGVYSLYSVPTTTRHSRHDAVSRHDPRDPLADIREACPAAQSKISCGEHTGQELVAVLGHYHHPALTWSSHRY